MKDCYGSNSHTLTLMMIIVQAPTIMCCVELFGHQPVLKPNIIYHYFSPEYLSNICQSQQWTTFSTNIHVLNDYRTYFARWNVEVYLKQWRKWHYAVVESRFWLIFVGLWDPCCFNSVTFYAIVSFSPKAYTVCRCQIYFLHYSIWDY